MEQNKLILICATLILVILMLCVTFVLAQQHEVNVSNMSNITDGNTKSSVSDDAVSDSNYGNEEIETIDSTPGETVYIEPNSTKKSSNKKSTSKKSSSKSNVSSHSRDHETAKAGATEYWYDEKRGLWKFRAADGSIHIDYDRGFRQKNYPYPN